MAVTFFSDKYLPVLIFTSVPGVTVTIGNNGFQHRFHVELLFDNIESKRKFFDGKYFDIF